MPLQIDSPTRILFFTGKGGVGKTTAACATAIALADSGKRVLLVGTDPASNLDEVLRVDLSAAPSPIKVLNGLSALNIDPEQAARDYRERVIGPYREVLPEAAIVSMEEQLSGACTVEIAAFDEFSKLLGDPSTTTEFDHIVFDTAPTGHTLRLLELPAAWTSFIDSNVGGTSCLGPLSGLQDQKALYAASNEALRDQKQTSLVLVARPERASLVEAERAREELAHLGISNLRLILNGVFKVQEREDPVAVALQTRGQEALDQMPVGLKALPRTDVPLSPLSLVGIEALRTVGDLITPEFGDAELPASAATVDDLGNLIDRLAQSEKGVVMTMGKGGVGKTSVAARIATALADRGFPVTLTTTDPAAHVAAAVSELGAAAANLEVRRIDPAAETERYAREVLQEAGRGLDAQGKALLEEDLRSPCTEEIAVFRAFADTVALGEERYVIIDTAPTGHTLLLLDAAESYHREVLKRPSGSPQAVRDLLPHLRDPEFTKVLLVTLPEATPIHEAMQLERDLARADIHPFSWVVNQTLVPLQIAEPLLRARQAAERRYLREVEEHASAIVLEPWRNESSVGKPSQQKAVH